MWSPNEWEEQTIDRLLRELGIRLPEAKTDDDDSGDPYDGDGDYEWLLDKSKSIER